MTRIKGPVATYRIPFGYLRAPLMAKNEIVGDRYVPPLIEVDLPGVDGQPEVQMVIEVLHGVPRCTELTIRRIDGGREIRPKDLNAIQLESWIENFVSLCSGEIDFTRGVATGVVGDSEAVRRGINTIREVRKGSRRPLTDERKQQVADIYNAHETGGIDAVMRAFPVSRSTAIRWIAAARDAGMIEKRKK